MALTVKKENFCNYYVELGGDASKAYRKAYSSERMKDKTIHKRASELLSEGEIKGRIKELQEELKKKSDITKERVLSELKSIAFSDIRDYIEFNGTTIRFKSFDDLTESQAKAIESIKETKNGIELTLHGKSWGIARICKMLGYDIPDKELEKKQVNVTLEI